MALNDTLRADLVDLLKECSAYLQGADGKSRGTGIIIDHDLLVTCAHVAAGKKKDKMRVTPYKRRERDGEIIDVYPEVATDLALVKVDRLEGEEPLNAAVVSPSLADNVDYFAVGYPREPVIGDPGIESREYKGTSRKSINGDDQFLVLQAGGAVITPGMSGGGVLSTVSGAVVALMQYTPDPDEDSGGAAIPVERAASLFPDVRRCVETPPVAAQRWRNLLGRNLWHALGHDCERRRKVDIFVSGSPRGWEVKLHPDDDKPCSINGSTLPADISEALFLWAQRRRLQRPEDVQLLGRLLGAALFPDRVLERLRGEVANDYLLVRLRIATDSDLIDVPWEFVTISHDNKDLRQVSTAAKLSLVRVSSHSDPDEVDTAPTGDKAAALVVVVQPDNWRSLLPNMVRGDQTVKWPDLKELEQTFRGALEKCKRLTPTVLRNPVSQHLREVVLDCGEQLEILHYIGFGRYTTDSKYAEIMLSGNQGDIDWIDLNDFFELAKDSMARILILEFLLPPSDRDYEPIPPKSFLPALRRRVNAVVYNRYHLHPHQINSFNYALYRAIGQGKSVEEAVQAARRDVMKSPFLGDRAAFGWFTLLTGPTPNMGLFDEQRDFESETDGGSSRQAAKPMVTQPENQNRDRQVLHTAARRDDFAR